MKRRMRSTRRRRPKECVYMYVYITCDIFSRWCNFKGRFDTIITFVLVLNSGSIKLRRKCCNNFSLYAILCCNYVCHVWGGQQREACWQFCWQSAREKERAQGGPGAETQRRRRRCLCSVK